MPPQRATHRHGQFTGQQERYGPLGTGRRRQGRRRLTRRSAEQWPAHLQLWPGMCSSGPPAVLSAGGARGDAEKGSRGTAASEAEEGRSGLWRPGSTPPAARFARGARRQRWGEDRGEARQPADPARGTRKAAQPDPPSTMDDPTVALPRGPAASKPGRHRRQTLTGRCHRPDQERVLAWPHQIRPRGPQIRPASRHCRRRRGRVGRWRSEGREGDCSGEGGELQGEPC